MGERKKEAEKEEEGGKRRVGVQLRERSWSKG